jgi:predicted nucleotidyltransferase
MLEMKNNPTDLSVLGGVFARYPEIEAVYLFGSAASGRANAESDIDLAVVPGTDELKSKKLELLGELAGRGFSRVDLLFLDGRDIVLEYEAVRSNRRVYQKPGFDSGSLYSAVVRRYLDFLPYLETQRKALKERILHGTA